MARNYTRKDPQQGGLTPEEVNSRKKSYFLRVLLENGGFRERAIKQCHTSRRWFNEQLETDEEFAATVQVITDITNEELLVEARRRATGYEEPIVYQGKIQTHYVDAKGRVCASDAPGAKLVPATVTKVSDTLLMFLIKGRMPEFRDGPGGKKSVDISDDELNERLQQWLARKTGKGKAPDGVIEAEAVS